MKTWLVTFADGAAYTSTRLVAQARASGYFDEIRAWGPADFDPTFWRTHRAFLFNPQRGYGLWVWKFYFAQRVLKEMRRGDVLVYMDSGSTLHTTPGARERFRDYLEVLCATPGGLLRFSKWLVLKQRCKGDAFVYCDAADAAAIRNGSELLAGIFLLRKCAASERFIGLLCEMIEQKQYYLFDNSAGRVEVSSRHKGHSNDQALSSLVARQLGCAVLANELEMAGDDFPLQLTRYRR